MSFIMLITSHKLCNCEVFVCTVIICVRGCINRAQELPGSSHLNATSKKQSMGVDCCHISEGK